MAKQIAVIEISETIEYITRIAVEVEDDTDLDQLAGTLNDVLEQDATDSTKDFETDDDIVNFMTGKEMGCKIPVYVTDAEPTRIFTLVDYNILNETELTQSGLFGDSNAK